MLLSTLAAGCRGDLDEGDGSLTLDLAFSPTPPAVGPARLIIILEDTAGVPVEGARVVIEGNMSHAGMVPVLATAEAEGPGRYGVAAFEFTMAGEWVLTVEANLPDGRVVRAQEVTNVVGRIGGGP